MNQQFDTAATSDLLREGSESYLDALYALHRYRQAVTEKAVKVLQDRLPKLKSSLKIEWEASGGAQAYFRPDGVGEKWDGNRAWVGATRWHGKPWSGEVLLGLTFKRGNDEIACPAQVTVALKAKYGQFQELSSALHGQDREGRHWHDEREKECGFSRPLRNPVSIEDEFAEMIGYFITVWTSIGGLDQILTR